jgi:hypothetical protein
MKDFLPVLLKLAVLAGSLTSFECFGLSNAQANALIYNVF